MSGITLRHHPEARPVLDGVDLHVAAGEFVVLVGPNGSGKSTLARIAAGLVEPSAGSVQVASPRRPGLVLQDPASQVVAATVERDVAFGLENQSMPEQQMLSRVAQVLRQVGIQDLARRDTASLSGGERQLVALAGVLALDVDVLVLDEPTSQLDAAARARLVQVVVDHCRSGGTSVLWVTQRAEELELGDRVVALLDGCVAYDGSVEDFVREPDLATRLGVGLPPAARLAHGLLARGVPLPRVPHETGDLVDLLAGT